MFFLKSGASLKKLKENYEDRQLFIQYLKNNMDADMAVIWDGFDGVIKDQIITALKLEAENLIALIEFGVLKWGARIEDLFHTYEVADGIHYISVWWDHPLTPGKPVAIGVLESWSDTEPGKDGGPDVEVRRMEVHYYDPKGAEKQGKAHHQLHPKEEQDEEVDG